MASRTLFHIKRNLVLATLLGSAAVFACSSDKGDGPNGSDAGDSDSSDSDSGDSDSGDSDSSTSTGARTGTGASSSVGGTGSGTGSTSGSSGGSRSGSACGISNENQGGSRPIETDFEACAEDSHSAETLPADIFIMIDQSISMGDNRLIQNDPESPTRWEVLTDALKGFISSSDSEGLRVGLQYFGINQNGAVSCDVDDYASADVEIAELPGNAGDLTASIDAHFPSSSTPSVPALEGALRYARDWAEDHPERSTLVVFATDGYPTECENSQISDLEALAKAYAEPTDGSPRIPTFVIGIGEVSNLTRVARAGGTGDAFFVGDCPSAVEDLQVALTRIATSPVACEFQIPAPDGELADLTKINFSVTPPGGEPFTFPRLQGESSCGQGWYFDDNSAPTRIIACPNTCAGFGSAVVDIVIGCETVILQ